MNFKKIGLILSIIASVFVIAFGCVKIGNTIKDKLASNNGSSTQAEQSVED